MISVSVPIQTKRLNLVPQSRDEALAQIDALPPDQRAQVSPDWLARVAAPNVDFWTLGFRVVERASGNAIGSCGYKGPPDADGAVEIAYGIDPSCQGRGYATEAADALTTFALSTGLVRLVRAHTLPEPNASTRVLAKCGFRFVGPVVDPEDGPVWRWERES